MLTYSRHQQQFPLPASGPSKFSPSVSESVIPLPQHATREAIGKYLIISFIYMGLSAKREPPQFCTLVGNFYHDKSPHFWANPSAKDPSRNSWTLPRHSKRWDVEMARVHTSCQSRAPGPRTPIFLPGLLSGFSPTASPARSLWAIAAKVAWC